MVKIPLVSESKKGLTPILNEQRPAKIFPGTTQVQDPLLGAFANIYQPEIHRIDDYELTENVRRCIYDVLIRCIRKIVIKNDINHIRRVAAGPRDRNRPPRNRGWRYHAHGELIGGRALRNDYSNAKREQCPRSKRKHFPDSVHRQGEHGAREKREWKLKTKSCQSTLTNRQNPTSYSHYNSRVKWCAAKRNLVSSLHKLVSHDLNQEYLGNKNEAFTQLLSWG